MAQHPCVDIGWIVVAVACSDYLQAALFVERGMKEREVNLRVSGHAPVAASLRTQRCRDVPLMANHGLSLRMASALCSA